MTAIPPPGPVCFAPTRIARACFAKYVSAKPDTSFAPAASFSKACQTGSKGRQTGS